MRSSSAPQSSSMPCDDRWQPQRGGRRLRASSGGRGKWRRPRARCCSQMGAPPTSRTAIGQPGLRPHSPAAQSVRGPHHRASPHSPRLPHSPPGPPHGMGAGGSKAAGRAAGRAAAAAVPKPAPPASAAAAPAAAAASAAGAAAEAAAGVSAAGAAAAQQCRCCVARGGRQQCRCWMRGCSCVRERSSGTDTGARLSGRRHSVATERPPWLSLTACGTRTTPQCSGCRCNPCCVLFDGGPGLAQLRARRRHACRRLELPAPARARFAPLPLLCQPVVPAHSTGQGQWAGSAAG